MLQKCKSVGIICGKPPKKHTDVISLLPGASFTAPLTFQCKNDGEIVITLDFPGVQIGGCTAGHSLEWLIERFFKMLPTRVIPLFRVQTKTMCQQD